MSSIRLFGSRLSPFVEKVARALELKGLDFELVPPASPLDFSRWNPTTGKMPVLETDGEKVFDSSRILRRLDQLRPSPPLFDADPRVAARQRLLEDWSDESLYWYAMGLRWSPVNANATASQVLGDVGVPSVLHPLLAPLLRQRIGGTAWAQGLQRLPMDILLEELALRLDELGTVLEGSAFFHADHVGGADLALYGQVRTMRSGPTPQAAALLEERAWIMDWMRRVEAATRPRP